MGEQERWKSGRPLPGDAEAPPEQTEAGGAARQALRTRELRRLREREAGYREALELASAVLAALCTQLAAGSPVRLSKRSVREALGRWVFAAEEDGGDYVLSFRQRREPEAAE